MDDGYILKALRPGVRMSGVIVICEVTDGRSIYLCVLWMVVGVVDYRLNILF